MKAGLVRSNRSAAVAAVVNRSYEIGSVRSAVHGLLQLVKPSLRTIVSRGARVLVKVNMACSGARHPNRRLTTHPAVVECIIEALIDCGAVVTFGDDASRSGKHVRGIYRSTGFEEVSKRTGARIIDFVAPGAREVNSGVLIPRSYLVTNAYYEADVVINAASCRSHVGVGMSGAIKNHFGFVIGKRKQAIHNLFPGDAAGFGRVIADVYRTVPADLSFLDLTTVAEGGGITSAVQPVGLMLAGTDAVALDTIAAQAIGYEQLNVWTTHFAHRVGLGVNDLEQIAVDGLDWNSFVCARLAYPALQPRRNRSMYDRASVLLNNTLLRPRPVIGGACTGCGDCRTRCPVGAIVASGSTSYYIDRSVCADCAACLKVCEDGAVQLRYVGLAATVRHLLKRSAKSLDDAPQLPHYSDPAPNQ
jgi:uncharacterized protein (DUF362 family)/NAD-dependent dihydropyrimidine dehydrogenase PreA subunit